MGIIEAAKETNKLTIGTSGEQIYLAPENVIGNRPKRVDTAVLSLIDAVLDDDFLPGVRSLGLKEEGISLGPFNKKIVTEVMEKRLLDLRDKIINGEIVIKATLN